MNKNTNMKNKIEMWAVLRNDIDALSDNHQLMVLQQIHYFTSCISSCEQCYTVHWID